MKLLFNVFSLILFFFVGRFSEPPIHFQWSDRFVLNRSFSGELGGIKMHAVAWFPSVLIFLFLGLGISLMVRSKKSIYWALSLGLSLALAKYLNTKVWFDPETGISSYIFHYSIFLLPIVFCIIGGKIGVILKNTLNKSLERDV